MIEKTVKYNNLIKIVHRAYCDDCKVELEHGQFTYMTKPPIFQYICPLCHKDYTSRQSFPYTEYVGDRITDLEVLNEEEEENG